jgi:ABC-type transport system involved in cytochrome c biogenesis permease subunit
VLDLVARVVPVHEMHSLRGPGPAGHGVALLSAHIFSATLGTALFGVAAAASIVYLIAEHRLKRKLLARFGSRPSLETLDAWNRQCIAFGFLAFTVAVITGTWWLLLSVGRLMGAPGPNAGVGQVVLFLFGKAQYSLSIITWLLYAALLVARLVAGLRGRRAAMLTLAGFLAALSVLVAYLLRDVRGLAP